MLATRGLTAVEVARLSSERRAIESELAQMLTAGAATNGEAPAEVVAKVEAQLGRLAARQREALDAALADATEAVRARVLVALGYQAAADEHDDDQEVADAG